MKIIRFVIGNILLFINFLTRPTLGVRSREKQSEVEKELENYSLYQFDACPFCIKVRRVMRRLNLPIELRNANTDSKVKAELLSKGGSSKVPCLRIGDTWIYESSEIILYLESRFLI